MHKLKFITGGRPLAGAGGGGSGASKALVLLHGRGGSAEDILSLADALPVRTPANSFTTTCSVFSIFSSASSKISSSAISLENLTKRCEPV